VICGVDGTDFSGLICGWIGLCMVESLRRSEILARDFYPLPPAGLHDGTRARTAASFSMEPGDVAVKANRHFVYVRGDSSNLHRSHAPCICSESDAMHGCGGDRRRSQAEFP